MKPLFPILLLMSLTTLSFASNVLPVANITTANGVFTAKAGQLMTFSGSTSYDPDGGGINYYWWYVDGVLKHSGSYASSFSWNQSSVAGGATKDTYSLMLKVRDNENSTKTKTITITVLAEERNYFVTDHLGNVRATVDQSGAVIGYDDYYPYGQVMPGRSSNTANANDIYKFTGHERDAELGLDYMLARNYDPEIGRFLSVDPAFKDWSNEKLVAYKMYENSPYMYVRGNPMLRIDPTGYVDWVATVMGGLTMAAGVAQVAAGIALTPVTFGGSAALIVSGTMTSGLGMGQMAVGIAESGQDIPSGTMELAGMASGNETARSIGKGADALVNIATTGVLGASKRQIAEVGRKLGGTPEVIGIGFKNIANTTKDIATKNLKVGATSHTEALARGSVSTVKAIENVMDVGGTAGDVKAVVDEVKKE